MNLKNLDKMKKIKLILVLCVLVVFSSCSSNKSLQEYFVDNSENPNFISLDIPASILNLEKADLTKVQKEAIQSLKKLNILAFKKTTENNVDFKIEKENVTAILKKVKIHRANEDDYALWQSNGKVYRQ